jgi:hypothetical protein
MHFIFNTFDDEGTGWIDKDRLLWYAASVQSFG